MSWEYWTPEPAPRAKANIAIPPKALEAGVKAFAEAEANDYTTRDQDLATAFRAMIEAWPGMTWACRGKGTPPHLLFLPLPQEASDE